MNSRIPFILLAIVLIVTSASAYEVIISAPITLQAGAPLEVNGSTDLPAGVSLNISFSKENYYSTELSTRNVIVQNSGLNKTFNLTFDTRGLGRGQYKVEVAPIHDYSFLGDSVTLIPVTLIDRFDEIAVEPPLKKDFDGTLVVAGTDQELKSSSVQVIISDPDGQYIFGPDSIVTNTLGSFSKTYPIEKPGNYTVSFSDRAGPITNVTYVIFPKQAPEPVPQVTGPVPLETSISSVSASSFASRDDPAIFAVVAHPGTVRLSTSTDIDWVLEYQSGSDVIHRINNAGTTDPEVATFESDGTIAWVKIYPYKFEDKGMVTLFVENALGVQPDKTGAGRFVPEETGVPANIQTSPLPVWLALCATGIGIALWRKGRSG
jgi:hypothetical protein